ncbi:hypothetical protein LMG919_11205 [Xanthomonas vesicatoria]|nr:hypothetical protein LMG919_11205 [Xanthomonas vesicatoria]
MDRDGQASSCWQILGVTPLLKPFFELLKSFNLVKQALSMRNTLTLRRLIALNHKVGFKSARLCERRCI